MHFSAFFLLTNRTAQSSKTSQTTRVNLSNLERRAGLASSALVYAAKALETSRRIGDRLAEMTALENLGLAHPEAGRIEEALHCLNEALGLALLAQTGEKTIQIELDILDVSSRGRRNGAVREGPEERAKGKQGGVEPAADTDAVKKEAEKGKGGALLEEEKEEADSGDGADSERYLARIDGLIARAETEGYRDLLPQAYRVKGRLLQCRKDTKADDIKKFLLRSLDSATQAQNLFEERDALRELLAWGDQVGSQDEIESWRERLQRMGEVLRSKESQ
jgi:tetratricopeptide (TPR) repeat protein